jgi:signal transduction histidine kinase/putative methionine-R-sulfoxide reductase with GAF domain
VVSTLELRPLLDVILDQLKLVVDFDGASILSLEDETLSVVAYRGPIPDAQAYHIDFPLDQAGVNQEVILRQEPAIIPDVRGQTEMARRFQQTAGEALHTTFGYIRSWMGIPLIVKNQIIGMISLDHSQANYYTPEHARLAQAFAVHVAVAIENARLYAETARRADEIQSLLAVQQAIAGPLEWSAVLQLIADEARRLTGSRLSAVYLLDGDEHADSLHLSVLSQPQDSTESVERLPVDLSVAGMALQTGEPILVSDAKSDPRVNPAVRREMEVQSFLVVPLIRDKTSRATGVILVADKASGALGADDERVLSILASGAVIQLENARLYEEEQTHRQEAERRRQVAEGLRDILKVLNSDRPRDETLDYIVAQAIRLLGANAGVIYRIDPNREFIAIEGACDMPPEFEELEVLPWLSTQANEATRSGEVFAVSDLTSRWGELPLDEISSHPLVKRWLQIISQNFQAYLSVPLVVKEEVYGDITLYYRQPHDFGEEEIGLAVSFADQAALSIENARLRDQVEQSAVAAERNRLARDLHDAVTQTLFSASLIAEVLPRLWDRHPEEAQRRVQELRELNRGALAEMRTLLLELRPSALVEAEMSELMRQLADSITGRARVPVTVEIEGDCQLPPTLKVVFYRIAQEALNNVAKHAEATQATVHLRCTPSGDELTERMVALRVCDDGRGFDPASISPKSLGVGIMRERAQSVGADLEIESQPGQGTKVRVVWEGQK